MKGKRFQIIRSPNKPNAEADGGYTLIEVLVVIGILALLAAVATPQVLRYLGHARTEAARIQIQSISTALELYLLENGSYPSQQAGLSALVVRPVEASRWRGPYLKGSDGLVDPWGRAYQYRIPGRSGAYEVFSLGRDNAPGGQGEDQDLVSR